MSVIKKLNANKKHNIIITMILIFMTSMFAFVNPNFVKSYNLLSMVQTLVPYAILTLGILFVVGSNNTDLSMGSVCIAAAVIAGKLYMSGMDLWLVIPVMIIVGLIFGVINGWLVAKMKLPSFIATLGTMMFSRGISSIIVGIPNIFYPSGTWYNRIFSNYNGFPVGIVWLLLFVIVTYILINKTKIGRYILSIGSNYEAARLSGVNSKLYVYIAYIISGISAGIAGIFWSASFATVASSTGNGMEFDAMAAAYIGGTSATGGSVNVVGSMIGMIMLVIIRSGLNFLLSKYSIDVNSTYVTYAVTGVIIVASLLIDIQSKKEKKKKNKKQKKTIIIISILLCLLGFGLFVFNKSKDEKDTIAVISKNETSSFWISVKDGCQKACDDYGYELSFRGPEGESPSYLPQALSLAKTQISNEPKAIVASTICEGFVDILTEAYDLSIPVISYDSGIYEADIDAVNKINKNPIVNLVSTNNYEAARLGAQNAYELVKEDIINSEDTYIVGAIQYEQSSTAEARANGFIEGFKELVEANQKTKGKCDYIIEVKPDQLNNNYKMALESLSERGASLIFIANLNALNQVYDAIEASNNHYDDIKFVGFDTGTKAIEWIKKESGAKLLGAIAQNSYEMGYKAVECAIKKCEGQEIKEDIYIPGVWYDVNNLEEMIEKGLVFEG